jgi:hypothetical protein
MSPQQTFLLARDIQLWLCGIILFGSLLLLIARDGSWALRLVPMLVTLVGFGTLALIMWGFGNIISNQPETLMPQSVRGIQPATGTLLMLFFDLGIVTLLVALTGGSERSCFSPLYFILPTFTLLLLDFGTPVVVYSICAISAFALTLFFDDLTNWFFRPPGWGEDDSFLVKFSRFALLVTSGICLGIAIYIDTQRHLPPQTTGVVSSTPYRVEEKIRDSASPPPSTRSEAPPVITSAAATATPTPTAPPAPTLSGTYSEFLNQLKGLHQKKESTQRRILTGYIGEHVSWDVEFQNSEPRRGETLVFFSEIASGKSDQNRPVKFAKVTGKYKKLVQRLHRGTRIRVEGYFRRHSRTELFVTASAITVLDEKDRDSERPPH